MHISDDDLERIGGRLTRLGLGRCRVCESESVSLSRVPVVLDVGGKDGTKYSDAETAPYFVARLTCDNCGYILLFDLQKFFGGPVQLLWGELKPLEPLE